MKAVHRDAADRMRIPGERWWCVAMIAAIVIPLVISAIHLLVAVGDDYFPTSDWALLELRTGDVSEHLITMGPFSRFNWNHPGPLLFYLLFLPYKIFGSSSIGLHIGAVLINAVTVVGCGLVAFRRGGLVVAVAVLVPLGLLIRALGPEVMSDPWNPHLPIIPLFLLFLLAWSVAVGDLWMAPVGAAVASFTVQSHTGMMPLTVALAVVACAVVCGRGLRSPTDARREYWKRVGTVGAISMAVVAVLWAPVVYGTLVVREGNLATLLRFFNSDRANPSVWRAFDVLGLQWGPRPEWITGARGFDLVGDVLFGPRWWIAIGIIAVTAATAVAVKRRDWDTIWFAVLLIVGAAGSVYAITGVVVPIYPYIVRWTWVLGAALGVLVLLAAWTAVPVRARAKAIRPIAAAAVIALALLGVSTTVDALGNGAPYEHEQLAEKGIAKGVLAALPPETNLVLVEDAGGTIAIPGLVIQLVRHGIDVDVVPDQPRVFGFDRRPTAAKYQTTLRVFAIDGNEAPATDGRLVARASRSRTRKEERSLNALITILEKKPPSSDRDLLLRDLLAMRTRPTDGIEVYLIERAK